MGTAVRLTVEENLALAMKRGQHRGFLPGVKKQDRKFFKEQLAQLNLNLENRLETEIGLLSGGNQQKVVIGRWVYAASQILLLDEPTRGVDIEAKQQIYRIVRELAAEGKSVVFISSEVEELPLVCDRILLLQHGTFSQEFHAPVNVDELMSAILSVH